MNFHVGQRVVCIDDGNVRGGERFSTLIRKGSVYTVSAVGLFSDGDAGVDLIEIGKAGPDLRQPDWLARRFRPVKETDISIFTAMLAPTPKQKEPV